MVVLTSTITDTDRPLVIGTIDILDAETDACLEE